MPHPIEDTLARLALVDARLRDKVRFVHLNHTNPALEPDSAALRTIEASGCHVAKELEVVPL